MNKKTVHLLRFIGAAVLLIVLLILGGVFHEPEVPPGVAGRPDGEPEPAHQQVVSTSSQPITYEAVGTVQSKNQVDISARIAGQIVAMNVDVGGTIEKGQLLVEISAAEIPARVAQAQSALAGAEAQATQAAAGLERVQVLQSKGAATSQELEAATAADLSARAAVTAAQKRLEEAEVSLTYTRIESPIDGIVAGRSADQGDMAWPGQPLLRIQDPQALRFEVAVREGIVGGLDLGKSYTVRVDGVGRDFQLPIEEVLPQADPRTRTVLVRGSLPGQESLRAGMFVRLELPIGLREQLMVPSSAIVRVGQLHHALVRQADRWVKRYVSVGKVYGTQTEVLSGITPNEMIGWND